jgi:transcription elongation factor Elf1
MRQDGERGRTISMFSRRRKEKGPRKVLTCPQCGSADLYYEAALITGYKYHCKRCGYIGAFVVEKELEEGSGE